MRIHLIMIENYEMVDYFKYFKVLLDGLGETESKFGIVIEDTEKFIAFIQCHPEFKFIKGSDYEEYINERTNRKEYNLWDSLLDKHSILGVCCTDKWIIVPRHSKKDYEIRSKHMLALESLKDKLNNSGYECDIYVLTKSCSCT